MAGNKNSGPREYVPTDEEREKVRVLKAGGMTDVAIAEVIGMTDKTLRKHFATELDKGSAKVRAEMLMARYNAAKGGNVQAQNKMLELVGASAAATVLKERETPSTATPRPGKKEIQQQAADAVAEGSKFAPPSGPRLAVNND